jgi:hypothetical protein
MLINFYFVSRPITKAVLYKTAFVILFPVARPYLDKIFPGTRKPSSLDTTLRITF